jgi:predicted nucleic acid-binding protein
MVKGLFDTCILVDYLRGKAEAQDEIDLYEDKSISIITWMEVMAGATVALERETRAFLGQFELIGLEGAVAERAVEIRKNRRIKLPDSIIQASAEVSDLLLITRNTKDFPAGLGFVRIPYEMGP